MPSPLHRSPRHAAAAPHRTTLRGFTLAFVGYGPEDAEAVLELTHSWDTPAYDLGNGFGHIAIAVPDAYAACAEIKRRGGWGAGSRADEHGTTVIAFVQDPDGWQEIELIQRS